MGNSACFDFFILFSVFSSQKVCQYKILPYLCTRFRKATWLHYRKSTMILDNIPYRQAVQRVL